MKILKLCIRIGEKRHFKPVANCKCVLKLNVFYVPHVRLWYKFPARLEHSDKGLIGTLRN